MIYFENKIGVPQDVMIVKEVSTKKTNKAVTEQQAREISKEEAKAAVDAQQFKTINDEDIRGTGNIEVKAGVTSVNGQSGDLKLKTINNNDILGEGNIEIQGGGTTDFSYFYIDAADFILPTQDELFISIPTANVHYYGDAPYRYGYITIKDKRYKKNTTIPLNFGTDGNTMSKFMYDTDTYELDFIDEEVDIYADKNLDPTTPICTFFARTTDDINNSGITVDNLPTVVGGTYITFGNVRYNVDADHYMFAKMEFGSGKDQYLVDANIVGYTFNDGTSDVTIRFCCEKGYYEATWLRQAERIKFTCLQVWNKVNSVNGKIGDIQIKYINGTNMVTSGPTSGNNIRIVQPLWKEAAVKCALKFKFKLDESGNEVIESVEPYGYQDIEPMKHEFFRNLYSMQGDQLANIGLYRAFFERKQDGIGGYSSQSTYGTINTWGETTILNTEEDPEAEDANYNYYVSFTVISPYTFQKYDVTVLSYYVSANVEEPNTWKIIWKKAN